MSAHYIFELTDKETNDAKCKGLNYAAEHTDRWVTMNENIFELDNMGTFTGYTRYITRLIISNVSYDVLNLYYDNDRDFWVLICAPVGTKPEELSEEAIANLDSL